MGASWLAESEARLRRQGADCRRCAGTRSSPRDASAPCPRCLCPIALAVGDTLVLTREARRRGPARCATPAATWSRPGPDPLHPGGRLRARTAGRPGLVRRRQDRRRPSWPTTESGSRWRSPRPPAGAQAQGREGHQPPGHGSRHRGAHGQGPARTCRGRGASADMVGLSFVRTPADVLTCRTSCRLGRRSPGHRAQDREPGRRSRTCRASCSPACAHPRSG